MMAKKHVDRHGESRRVATSAMMSHGLHFPFAVGLLLLAACHVSARNVEKDDPSGVYALVAVDGAKLPATVSHGAVKVEVHAGVFTINADGTCRSTTVFGPPSDAKRTTREVAATYTRKGSTLAMQWKGAGRTSGTFEGDRFTMENEGMVFSYEKQPGSEVLDKFLGTWKSVHTVGPGDAEKRTVDLTYSRVLGGKFVQELGMVSGKNTAMIMYAFDTRQNRYRAWRFAAADAPSEATGTWNEGSNTLELEWTSVTTTGEEVTTTSRHQFVNDDVFKWNVVGKDGTGKILFRMEGKATRTNESN